MRKIVESLKRLYEQGRLTQEQLADRVEKGTITIEEYNEIMRQVTLPAKIVGIIFQVCLLLLLIYLARKYKIGQFSRRKKEL